MCLFFLWILKHILFLFIIYIHLCFVFNMKHCSISKAQMISSHSNQKFIILNLMKQSHFCCNTCFGNMNLFEHDWYITKFPICINVILPVRNTKSDPNQGNFAPERISGDVRRHFWHLDIKGAGNHPTMSKNGSPTPSTTQNYQHQTSVAKQVRTL